MLTEKQSYGKNAYPENMRAKTAAAFLAVAESTFWRWVQQGRIPKGTRLSARATIWKREDLERFLKQAADGGAA